jgi:hypothetical protein
MGLKRWVVGVWVVGGGDWLVMQSVRPQTNWGRGLNERRPKEISFVDGVMRLRSRGGIRVGEHRVVKSIQVGRPNLQEHRVGDFFPRQRPVGLVRCFRGKNLDRVLLPCGDCFAIRATRTGRKKI